jgi:hypothetical protein
MAGGNRWEYMWIACRSEDGVEVVYRVNGDDLAETQKQRTGHFLQAAGAGGWELVGVADQAAQSSTSLWFKRLAT